MLCPAVVLQYNAMVPLYNAVVPQYNAMEPQHNAVVPQYNTNSTALYLSLDAMQKLSLPTTL